MDRNDKPASTETEARENDRQASTSKRFLDVTRGNAPGIKRAREVHREYVAVLQDLEPDQWSRFFHLLEAKEDPIELAEEDAAVGRAYPADRALFLLRKTRNLDIPWWLRYKTGIRRFVSALVGVPIVGQALEWLFDNWDQVGDLIGTSATPVDVFQAEEYTFMAIAGAWASIIWSGWAANRASKKA